MTQLVFRAGTGRLGTWPVPIVYALSLFAFIADLWRVNTLAYGLLYIPLVSTAVFLQARQSAWLLAGVAASFDIIGAFFPAMEADIPDLVGNRVLSLIAIFATAFFVHQARIMQERLAEQTRRAEAAERIKSEVLANLSNEIRTPLHRLLSVSQLMMLDGRPERRDALMRIRTGTRALLTNVENLIDLTSLDERPTQPERLDARAVAREALEQAGIMAAERQVALQGPNEGVPVSVRADGWAFRRVIDTLLLNAIAHAPAGGLVSLRLNRQDDAVTLSVSDPGSGVPRPLAEDTVSPAVGTGLALSVRLAQRMGGRLVAVDQADTGAVVQLRLPVAEPDAN